MVEFEKESIWCNTQYSSIFCFAIIIFMEFSSMEIFFWSIRSHCVLFNLSPLTYVIVVPFDINWNEHYQFKITNEITIAIDNGNVAKWKSKVVFLEKFLNNKKAEIQPIFHLKYSLSFSFSLLKHYSTILVFE